mmetsp:Transcript_1327/g.3301  ORF Transcript_1327/g.3301 Transcript_1327/m.3301 type:complete len:259 (+) Transcript_1327:105-881(+)
MGTETLAQSTEDGLHSVPTHAFARVGSHGFKSYEAGTPLVPSSSTCSRYMPSAMRRTNLSMTSFDKPITTHSAWITRLFSSLLRFAIVSSKPIDESDACFATYAVIALALECTAATVEPIANAPTTKSINKNRRPRITITAAILYAIQPVESFRFARICAGKKSSVRNAIMGINSSACTMPSTCTSIMAKYLCSSLCGTSSFSLSRSSSSMSSQVSPRTARRRTSSTTSPGCRKPRPLTSISWNSSSNFSSALLWRGP